MRVTLIRRHLAAALVALAVLCLSAKPAQATPIGIRYDMTLTLLAGVDTLGLNGATASFTAMFDDSVPYGNVSGLARSFTTSDLLTISGASVASSNGSFTASNTVRFFPTFDGQFFAVGGFITYTFGAVPLMIGHLATPVSGVNPGDFMQVSDFGTTVATTLINPGCVFCASTDTGLNIVTDSRYGVSSFSATVVPEPATVTMVGFGLVGLARLRRRRTK